MSKAYMLHRSPYAYKTELFVGTLILQVHLLFWFANGAPSYWYVSIPKTSSSV